MYFDCTRPRRLGKRPRRVPQLHRERFSRAKEMERLRKMIERRQVAWLWGQKRFVTPRLLSRVFGDGKQTIWLSGINTRPAYWVIRVDSTWTLDNLNGGNLRDHLEEIYQAIEEEFGTGEKEDGSLYYDAHFPQACDLGMGCSWGDYDLTKLRERELQKA